MTGASAGLGAHTLERLDATGARTVVGARTPSPRASVNLPLDLSSSSSVASFAAEVARLTGPSGIDALVLNAGIQYGDNDQRTSEGYEVTFAVNHVAHFRLLHQLLPLVNDGGRIIITTSDTHDPALYPVGPSELDVDGWSDGSAEITGIQAYAASKLANLLTAMRLDADEDLQTRGIRAFAYNPALTGGTELQRAQPELRARIADMGAQPQGSGPYVGTPERSGEVLADLTLGTLEVPADAFYVSLVRGEVTFPQPSELARRTGVADRLWNESVERYLAG